MGMRQICRLQAAALAFLGMPVAAARPGQAPAASGGPVRIIFDTDMDSDCDDAGALAVLHALADRGEVEILATVVSSLYQWNVPCVEAINRYYGRPDLPIGSPKRDAVDSHAGSRYARQIAESCVTRLKSNAGAADAVRIYRRALASQDDGAVVIVSVGDLTNLRNLLRSPADEFSDLAGPELVRRKVARWVCMGGRYPSHLDPKVYGNFKTDPTSTVEVARDWPTDLVFTGLGEDILTGSRLKETPPDNPVRRAYELYLGDAPARPSWDEVAVLYAARPDAPFWRTCTIGHNHIFPNGTNEWRDQPDSGNHVLLLLRDAARDEVGARIDGLMVQPPKCGRPAAGASAIGPRAAHPWSPHPKAAPVTERRGDAFAADANGTRTCSGGWQWRFDGIEPGKTYEIAIEASYREIAVPRDALTCVAIWGAPAPDQDRAGAIWEYLLPGPCVDDRVGFSRRAVAPERATNLTVRATLRWTATGKTLWHAPRVALAKEPLVKSPPVRVCVVTGHHTERRGRQFKTVQDNVDFYGALCEDACQNERPRLIVLPEIALQWGVPGEAIDLAVPAPGPETEAFAAIARRHRTRIALGMHERDGDAVHNSVILIGPNGSIEGRYRKVHLAADGEDTSGVLPGDGFPVFDTDIGRIGFNICMDSSAAESSRMVGLNGAELLLLPIMGDHRADRWSFGQPIFNEDRWRAIMRTHAIDNQLCMVVARNNALGSCIIDRKGEILAWNDGDRPYIAADVGLGEGHRIWQGGCFRDVNWFQRRPHLYGPFTDTANHGGSR